MTSSKYILAQVYSTQDHKGEDKELTEPVYINLVKEAPRYNYPLTYAKDFVHSLYEEVKMMGPWQCQDSHNHNEPSCGWQYDSNGEKIENSQGFCCACNAVDFNYASSFSRGNSCQFIALNKGSTSAHCLKHSEPIWSGYEISAPYITYGM